MLIDFAGLMSALASDYGIARDETSAETARAELSEKLRILDCTPEQFEIMLKTVSRVLRALTSRSRLVEDQREASLKTVKNALKSLRAAANFESGLHDDSILLWDAIQALEPRVQAAKYVFEIVHGKRGSKRGNQTFKRGRNPEFLRDAAVFSLVNYFDQLISAKEQKLDKGSTARALTLLLFNSVGLNAASAKGAVTGEVIKKSYHRGKAKHLKMINADLTVSLAD